MFTSTSRHMQKENLSIVDAEIIKDILIHLLLALLQQVLIC